ncbi:hypothetical protein [Acidipropionibacterium timonense]|uniref:hypothetical protein n=1 Tax=Acidipropionibacterium timonense TaxID=2161818 RepID=UPI001030D748|nr:hypothetical protein [Acidipropionibacterium timonense]
MVASVLRFAWRSTWGSWRTAKSAAVVGWVVIGAFGIISAVGLAIGAWTVSDATATVHGSVGVLLGVLVLAAWVVLPVIAFGSNPMLDPGRFALFPVRSRDLLPGLLAAALTGFGSLLTLVVVGGLAASWRHHPAAVVAAVIGGLLGLVTSVATSRWLIASFSAGLASRRFRDLTAIVVGVIAMASGIGTQYLTPLFQDREALSDPAVVTTGEVLGWTPVGWAWALPGDVGAGHWGLAALRLGLAAATVLGLLVLWERAIDRALVSPLAAGHATSKASSTSPVDRIVPNTVAGAIAARQLRYLRRDPRMVTFVLTSLIVPLAIAVPLMINGGGEVDRRILLVLLPAALSMYAPGQFGQLISYDGSALWVQIQAGVRGVEDRWGRTMAYLVVILPVQTLVIVAVTAWLGRWGVLLALLGVTWGAALVATGVGSVIGAVSQSAMPEARQGAFATGSFNGTAFSLTLASMPISIILCAPSLVLLGVAIWGHQVAALSLAAAVVGLVVGALVCWGGVRWGGHLIERDWAAVLQRVVPTRS